KISSRLSCLSMPGVSGGRTYSLIWTASLLRVARHDLLDPGQGLLHVSSRGLRHPPYERSSRSSLGADVPRLAHVGPALGGLEFVPPGPARGDLGRGALERAPGDPPVLLELDHLVASGVARPRLHAHPELLPSCRRSPG